MIFYFFLLALVPPMLVMAMIFFSDRFEKEPLHKIFICITGGVLVTIPIMLLVKICPGFFSIRFASSTMNAFFSSFVHAAFLEETLKFLIIYFIVLRSKYFNEPFDAVVYYVAVGVGFAVIENLQYITMGSQEALTYGQQTGLYVPFMQVSGIMAVIRSLPGHTVFAALSGFFISKYQFGTSKHSKKWLWLAWGVALFVHGTFNFLLHVFPGNSAIAGASWLFFAAGVAVFLTYPLLLDSPFNKPRGLMSRKARKGLRDSKAYGRNNWRMFIVFTVLFMLIVIGTYFLNRWIVMG
ncbi:PrsW family intramembrane metalloprotease [bacterium]|nr:PrsW family intramembrane metalloprotease [bacterium]